MRCLPFLAAIVVSLGISFSTGAQTVKPLHQSALPDLYAYDAWYLREADSTKFTMVPSDIHIEKQLAYDRHTLEDEYAYGSGVRRFQWDKIKRQLDYVEYLNESESDWAVLQNYKNYKGAAPVVKQYKENAYDRVSDIYGIERYQSAPLYALDDTLKPVRYGRDGSLIRIVGKEGTFYIIENTSFEGHWLVPERYVWDIEAPNFNKAIFVDRKNQNLATLENKNDIWYVRSMNPVTTGLHRPPYQHETPKGIFVIQQKKEKMIFLKDGSDERGGFAPHASRFCNGGYIHGVPVNAPATEEIEFSWTLGTTPRSHMCIRTATSHAEFIYNWEEVGRTLVFIFD